MSVTTWAEITDIGELEGAEQAVAADRFLDGRQGFLGRLGSNLVCRNAITDPARTDEVYAIVTRVAHATLTDPTQHVRATAYDSWAQAVALAAQTAVRRLIEPHEQSDLPGA